ncbi:MAG: ABC-2 transporter permease [Dehalobacterium sp.]
MLSLIYKDILIQKKTVLFSFLYIIFIIFAFQKMGPAMFPAGIVAFTYMLVLSACAYEDKNKADIMLNSLPISRSRVVLAKYLSVLVFLVIGIVCYVMVTFIMQATALPIKTYPVSLAGILSTLLAVSLINGLYFPVFFKIGYTRSRIFNFLLFFGVFFGITILTDFIQENQESIFLQQIAGWFSAQSDIMIAVLMIAMISVVLLSSFTLSLIFYRKREF